MAPPLPATTRRVALTGRVAMLAIAYLVLAATVGWIVWQESSVLPPRYFGTPGAPHSDALSPWLQGALGYYFLDLPASNLYRPTIGIFFASILSAVFDTRAIPVAFFVATTLFLARMFHKLPEKMVVAVVLWLAMGGFAYVDFFSGIAPWTLMIDFAAMFFTLAGVLLGLRAIDAGNPRQLVLSCLPLGIAAAIRGPMLFGGIALLALAAVSLRKRRHCWPYVGLAALVWLLPFAVDIAIQKQYGVTNNGLLSLFCFYADPRGQGMYSDECWELFKFVQPSAAQVLREYSAYLFSARGMQHWFSVFADCWVFAAQPLVKFLPPLSLLAGFLTAALFLTANADTARTKRLAVVTGGLVAGAAVLFAAGRLQAEETAGFAVAGGLALGLPLYAWRRRSVPVGGLYLVFFASCVFLASVGMAIDRLIITFAFALHLGFLLALVDGIGWPAPPADATANDPPDRLTTGAFLGLIALLYAGNSLIDLPPKAELKKRYKEEVHQRQAAIKIASERRFGRSLYRLGDGNIVYTRYDQQPVGSVIQYSYLVGADGGPAVFANDSLKRPVRFIQ